MTSIHKRGTPFIRGKNNRRRLTGNQVHPLHHHKAIVAIHRPAVPVNIDDSWVLTLTIVKWFSYQVTVMCDNLVIQAINLNIPCYLCEVHRALWVLVFESSRLLIYPDWIKSHIFLPGRTLEVFLWTPLVMCLRLESPSGSWSTNSKHIEQMR